MIAVAGEVRTAFLRAITEARYCILAVVITGRHIVTGEAERLSRPVNQKNNELFNNHPHGVFCFSRVQEHGGRGVFR